MRNLLIASTMALAGCGSVPVVEAKPEGRIVVASVYWQPQRVACGGGRFNPAGHTFAHRTLPCGTRVRFTASNGRQVVARLDDRGPYIRGREVDLSDGTARALGLGRSVHRVRLELLR